MIRVLFKDQASRDAFANRFKLTTTVDTDKLDIGWHLLQAAKKDPNATSAEQVQILTAGAGSTPDQDFIVNGDPAVFDNYVTDIVKNLGKGFYHVRSADGVTLSNHVDSIEHTGSPMTFMENVISMTNGQGSAATLDPTSSEGQWARIRVVSRYRPLQESFSLHDVTYKSTPELFVMDTGINKQHPEFQYSGIEIVDFYTLPVFNNNYNDDVGHGTATTSMAAGKNLGITNHVKIMNTKIGGLVNGSPYSATLLEVGEAIDAIVAYASVDPNKSRIVNMSWGIARSSWLDAKVQSLVDMGITVICAAGNQGISVEDISPAGLDTVMTIASIDKYDIPSGFNNISPGDSGLTTGSGLSLDMFAPGEDVMVANYQGGYMMASGTSLSAPLVAGVAVEIAAVNSGMYNFSDMKNTLLSTATENAILFEDDDFTEDQNKILYLFTSDTNAAYKNNDMTMYLGVHQNNEPIVVNLKSTLDTSMIEQYFSNQQFTWNIAWSDPEIETSYKQFMQIDNITGILTINPPTIEMPPETKLKMILFAITASSDIITMTSPTLFYFQTNPLYQDTLDSDITLALTDTNSISFYALWNTTLK